MATPIPTLSPQWRPGVWAGLPDAGIYRNYNYEDQLMDDERLQTTAMLLSMLHEEQIVTLISRLTESVDFSDRHIDDLADGLAVAIIALEDAIAASGDGDPIAEAWAAAEVAPAVVLAADYDADFLAGMMTA